jgi:hypothetical protein
MSLGVAFRFQVETQKGRSAFIIVRSTVNTRLFDVDKSVLSMLNHKEEA